MRQQVVPNWTIRKATSFKTLLPSKNVAILLSDIFHLLRKHMKLEFTVAETPAPGDAVRKPMLSPGKVQKQLERLLQDKMDNKRVSKNGTLVEDFEVTRSHIIRNIAKIMDTIKVDFGKNISFSGALILEENWLKRAIPIVIQRYRSFLWKMPGAEKRPFVLPCGKLPKRRDIIGKNARGIEEEGRLGPHSVQSVGAA